MFHVESRVLRRGELIGMSYLDRLVFGLYEDMVLPADSSRHISPVYEVALVWYPSATLGKTPSVKLESWCKMLKGLYAFPMVIKDIHEVATSGLFTVELARQILLRHGFEEELPVKTKSDVEEEKRLLKQQMRDQQQLL